MFKTKKQIIVVSSLILGIVVGLIVYFGLIATGAINLVQRSLIFTSGSKEIEYSPGTTLVCHEYDLEVGNLYSGHYVEVDFFSKLTTVGSTENEFHVTIYDSNDNVVTSKYEINKIPGTLTILGVPIKIKTLDATKIYDGTPLEYDSWHILSGGLLEGHSMEVDVIGQRVDAGIGENDFILTVFDTFDKDVTNLYAITKELGNLEVTPRTISVFTESESKEYDGTPLSNKEYTKITNEIDGHEFHAKTYKEIEEIGTVDNDIIWWVLDEDENDVSSNYIVSLSAGVLEVTLRNIEVVTFDATKIYDGIELTSYDAITEENLDGFSVYGLLENHSAKIHTPTTITNVGEFENIVILKIVDSDGNDFTEYYFQNNDNGILSISAYDIVIYTPSDEKTYDATDLYNYDYEELNPDLKLVSGDRLHIIEYTKFNYVETFYNEIKFDVLNSDDEVVTENYNISIIKGLLTIHARKITITTDNYTFCYDGSSRYLEYITNNKINTSQIIEEWKPEYAPYPIIDVGTVVNDIQIVFEDAKYEQNYDITYIFGTVTITKQPIYVQTASENFEYEFEKFHSYEKLIVYTVTPYEKKEYDGDFTNNLLEVSNYISVTKLGTYYNTADIALIDSDNYELFITWGGITIWEEDRQPISITPNTITVAPTNSIIVASNILGTTNNLTGLSYYTSQGYTYTATISGELDGSSYSNGQQFAITTIESFYLYDESKNLVASYEFGQFDSELYRVNVLTGFIVMTDVTIYASSEGAEKDYDGLPLIASPSITVDGALPNGYRTAVLGASITNAGVSNPVLKVYDNEDNDVTHLFNIVNNMEQLVVYKIDLTLTLGDINASMGQDLSELDVVPTFNNNLGININPVVKLHGFAPTIEYTRVSITSSNAICTIYDDYGVNITSNFNIKYVGNILVTT